MSTLRFIGRPWMRARQMYPWRPLGNQEARARWECVYRLHMPLEQRKWMKGKIGQRYREQEQAND